MSTLFVAALTATLLAAPVSYLALDGDADGLLGFSELGHGLSPWATDSDHDGIGDGDESCTSPIRSDSDEDGVRDGDEVRRGLDPCKRDTDGDGLPDGQLEDLDCNSNGIDDGLEPDRDNDTLLDGHELQTGLDFCIGDEDQDGLLDGYETYLHCVLVSDCDADGVPDADEHRLDLNPINPRTHQWISDYAWYAGSKANAAPEPDLDRDAIPDNWEAANGPIPWHGVKPQAGRRDLLIEVLRIEYPGTEPLDAMPYQATYDAVSAFFATHGIHVEWNETRLQFGTDPTTSLSREERNATLAQAGNQDPFAMFLVLDPHFAYGKAAGVAFRTNLAFMRLSAYGAVQYEDETGRQFRIGFDAKQATRTENGNGGTVYTQEFQSHDSKGQHRRLRAAWTDLFHAQPASFTDAATGAPLQVDLQQRYISQPLLAPAIIHEIGHTLGLCHAHEPTCNAKFTESDRGAQANSTMSYDADDRILNFLDSEWATIDHNLECPATDIEPSDNATAPDGHRLFQRCVASTNSTATDAFESQGVSYPRARVPAGFDLVASNRMAILPHVVVLAVAVVGAATTVLVKRRGRA